MAAREAIIREGIALMSKWVKEFVGFVIAVSILFAIAFAADNWRSIVGAFAWSLGILDWIDDWFMHSTLRIVIMICAAWWGVRKAVMLGVLDAESAKKNL